MSHARQIVLPSRRTSCLLAGLVAVLLTGVSLLNGVIPGANGSPMAQEPEQYSIWSEDTRPAVPADPEVNAVQLGVRFTTSKDGWVRAIRFYKAEENVGEHRGVLYDASGDTLAETTFENETAEGWQEAALQTPVRVVAGSTYVAAYTAPKGRYADDLRSLSPSKSVTRYALTAVQGVYSYGGDMPSLVWNDSNYYVDVSFATASPTEDAGSPTTSTSSTSTSSTTSSATSSSSSTSTSSTTSPTEPTTTSPPTSPSSSTSPTTRPTATRPPSSSTTSSGSPTSSDSGGLKIGCATLPSVCGYPDASNTGVPAGKALVKVPDEATSGPGWVWDSRGWVNITGDGAVFDGYAVNATIDVNAGNVTIRNNRLTSGGEGFGIALRHASSTTIANNDIVAPSGNRLMVGIKDIYGDSGSPVITGNDISGTGTGIQIDQGLIEDNYIHDMGYKSGDHINGTTSNGGSRPLTIRHNTIFNQYEQTDAISLFQDFGVQANRVIDNNLLAGGGYTIYAGANPGKESSATNIQVTNNRIAKVYFPRGGYYGPYTAYSPSGGNTFVGNVWDDTLALLG